MTKSITDRFGDGLGGGNARRSVECVRRRRFGVGIVVVDSTREHDARSQRFALGDHVGLARRRPTTLDYVQSADYSPDIMVSNMCDNLLRLTPTFGVEPALATSWKYTTRQRWSSTSARASSFGTVPR